MTVSMEQVRGPGSLWRVAGWGAAACLLLVPLVAMRFTDEVKWDGFDFMFAAFMLGSVGLGLELAVRNGNRAYSAAAGVALVAGFLLIWVNGAVGIIGNEQDDVNMLFLGVVGVALIGAVVALGRPAGMALAMSITALGQLSVPVIAAALALSPAASIWAPEAIGSTIVFTALWLGSAWLFRTAGK